MSRYRGSRASMAHLRYLYSLSFCLLKYPTVSRSVVKQLVLLSKKHQIRLSINMKRSICTKCWSLQVPAVTSDTSIERSVSGLGLVSRCRVCTSTRKFMMRGEKGLRKSSLL